jgi:hypothetical protein
VRSRQELAGALPPLSLGVRPNAPRRSSTGVPLALGLRYLADRDYGVIFPSLFVGAPSVNQIS